MATVARRAETPVLERNRLEIISWVFMRVSGVLLLFLALGHFAIQHIVNDVHNLSIDFVAARWAGLTWRVYDALLLGLALVHGLNGLRFVVDDYVLHPGANKVLRWAILIGGGIILVIGTVAIIGGVRKP